MNQYLNQFLFPLAINTSIRRCNLVKITIIVSFLRLLCRFLASQQKWAELELSMYTWHLVLSTTLTP
jgi:hypothetical protein